MEEEEEREREEAPSRIRYILIFSLILALLAIIATVFSYPAARRNIASSSLKRHISAFIESVSTRPVESVRTALYSIDGPVLTTRAIAVKNRDELHLTLEALLDFPTKEELKLGYISYIPAKTELIGASETDGHIYVDLSEELLSSANINRAIEQISITLSENRELKSLTILINGRPEDLIGEATY